MADVEYPILGEVLAVDLANTLYSWGEEATDFLETPELASSWWEALCRESVPSIPSGISWTFREHRRLVSLRDAVRGVLLAAADGTRAGNDELGTINACMTRAPVPRLLTLASDRGASALQVVPGQAVDTPAGAMGVLADSCVGLFAGAGPPSVGRCEGPDCPLLFVRRHARRRFCDQWCAHRGRQARYQRRHRTGCR